MVMVFSGGTGGAPQRIVCAVVVVFFGVCWRVDAARAKVEDEPAVTTTCIAEQCPSVTFGYAGQLFVNLILTLTSQQCDLVNENQYPDSYSNQLTNDEEFDFIIVGGSSAAPILAHRLAENPDWKILLIEAGGIPSATSKVPGLFPLLRNTEEDWSYLYESEKKVCLGFVDSQCYCPQAKVLGGYSTIDYINYLRGSPCNYNSWAALFKDQSWRFENILPYYLKAENTLDPKYVALNHGVGGPVTLNYQDSKEPIKDSIYTAATELGVSGYFECLSTIDQGERVSTATAYIAGCNKENLKILYNVITDKIIINSEKQATGVEFKINDTVYTIRAKNEVILSAGSIRSAQTLMLSGVGPRKVLKSVDIPLITKSPVGENLLDQFSLTAFVITLSDEAVLQQPSKLDILYNYFMNRSGPLSNIGLLNLISRYLSKPDLDCSDVMFVHYLIKKNDATRPVLAPLNFQESYILEIIEANKEHNILIMVPVLTAPKSRGVMTLRNNFSDTPPILNSNFLSDKEDIETLLRAVRFMESIVAHPALQQYNACIIKFNLPNCDCFVYQSDDYYRCLIRHYGAPLFSAAGTCKMGAGGDDSAVLTPTFQVRGVDRLRVIDASFLPTMISATMSVLEIMLGEKGSDIIKSNWVLSEPSKGNYDNVNKDNNGEKVNINNGSNGNKVDGEHDHLYPFNRVLDWNGNSPR